MKNKRSESEDLTFWCLMPKGEKKFYLASVCFSDCILRLSVICLISYLIIHGLYDLMLYEFLCLMSIHEYAYYSYCYIFYLIIIHG
jgi:hypothetical protein